MLQAKKKEDPSPERFFVCIKWKRMKKVAEHIIGTLPLTTGIQGYYTFVPSSSLPLSKFSGSGARFAIRFKRPFAWVFSTAIRTNISDHWNTNLPQKRYMIKNLILSFLALNVTVPFAERLKMSIIVDLNQKLKIFSSIKIFPKLKATNN